jgi:hypothetical protein
VPPLASAAFCLATVSSGILPILAAPQAPHRRGQRSGRVAGWFGCNTVLSPTRLPYQATPALNKVSPAEVSSRREAFEFCNGCRRTPLLRVENVRRILRSHRPGRREPAESHHA